MMVDALAAVAAVATATAIVIGFMLRSAKRDLGVYKAQVMVANDTAEAAVRTADRMRQALRVAGEEIEQARAVRDAADEVLEGAEQLLEASTDLEGLADAWEALRDRPTDP